MGTVSRVHTFASGAVLTAAQLNNEFDNLLTSSAINGGLDATNLGVTAGQITASKAIVVDGSRNLDDGTTSNQINNLVLSGTLTVAGATTQTGALSIDDTTDSTSTTTGSIHTDGGVGIAKDLIVGDDVKLLTDSAVLSLGVGSDATLTHDGTTGLTIAANPITVDSGDALTLDAHTGIHIFKAAGTEVLRFTEGNSGDVTIKLATNGKDLIFTDHGDATGLKVLDAAAGINVPGEVQTTKIAYTDGDDALTIADGGGVTTSGTFESGGAATLASLVCTAAGTFGGGYGATGATISTAGVIQANGAITSDGAVTGATLAGTVSTAAQNSITSASSLATVGTIGTGVWQGTAVASAYLDADTAHLSTTQTFTGDKTFTGTLTVGVDDTGKDVKFFGASAGAYMEWDESADQLRILGPSADAADSSGKLLLATAQTAVAANDILGQIDFQAPLETGTDATAIAAAIRAVAQGTFSASVNATDLIFYTGHSEAATEKFRMTSQGELGVGGANYGTDGQVLTSGGAGAAPTWADASGGTFSGPGSSTENAIVRFTNTSGNSGDNSGILIDDSNNVTGAGNVTLSGELDAATGDFSGDVDVDGTLETDALTIGGTALLANDTNNRVTTATGSGTLNGEANLTFDGSTLGVAGAVTITKNNDYGVSTYDGTNAGGTIGLGTLSADANGGWLFKNLYYNGSAWAVNNSSVGAGAMKFDSSGNIIWLTQASGSGLPAERMRIDNAGKVGIGTTAPDGLLHVHTATAGSVTAHANADELVLENSGAAGMQILAGTSAGCAIYLGDSDSNVAGGIVYDNGDDHMHFQTATVERMRLTSAGNVAIGTASDITGGDGALRAKIVQDGNYIAAFENAASSGGPLGLDVDFSATAPDNNSAWFMRLQDSSAVRGYWYSDGDVWTSDAGTLTSDERLKTNIVDASDKLADLMRLKVRNYEWTPEYHPNKVGEKKIGFIAQELETVFPSLITEHDIARNNKINEVLYTVDDDTQYYVDGDELPDGKQVGDVKTPSQIPDGKEIGDVKVAAKAHEPTMRKSYKNAFAPILVKALQEVTTRLEAAEAKIAALESA